MSQNPTLNKFSSFLGIALLIFIVAFTIFINFVVEEPTEKIEEIDNFALEEELVFEDTLALSDTVLDYESRHFMEYELADFWKLENIHTDSITINLIENRTYMKIYRELGFTPMNPFRDSTLLEIIGKEKMKNLYKDFSPTKYRVYNGIISFKHILEEPDSSRIEPIYFFNEFHIHHLEAKDFEAAMNQIANTIVDYQIKSITTSPEAGNFTQIEFKGGKKVFLIKRSDEIVDKSYKEIIMNADYLNDSTKIILP